MMKISLPLSLTTDPECAKVRSIAVADDQMTEMFRAVGSHARALKGL
jgi:hypothetical protein